ncbi:MAG: HPP family protein [Candidatus Binatia bacterium]
MSRSLSELREIKQVGIEKSVSTKVAEVMTRDVIATAPDHSVQEAITLVARHRFRHLLVVMGDQRLAGVISDRDLLRFMIREPQWGTAAVAEIMKADPITVNPDTPLSAAVAEMLNRRINCLPVVDADNRVVGILTSTDLLRALHKLQEWIEQSDSVNL